jgi:hypothetical protein
VRKKRERTSKYLASPVVPAEAEAPPEEAVAGAEAEEAGVPLGPEAASPAQDLPEPLPALEPLEGEGEKADESAADSGSPLPSLSEELPSPDEELPPPDDEPPAG